MPTRRITVNPILAQALSRAITRELDALARNKGALEHAIDSAPQEAISALSHLLLTYDIEMTQLQQLQEKLQ